MKYLMSFLFLIGVGVLSCLMFVLGFLTAVLAQTAKAEPTAKATEIVEEVDEVDRWVVAGVFAVGDVGLEGKRICLVNDMPVVIARTDGVVDVPFDCAYRVLGKYVTRIAPPSSIPYTIRDDRREETPLGVVYRVGQFGGYRYISQSGELQPQALYFPEATSNPMVLNAPGARSSTIHGTAQLSASKSILVGSVTTDASTLCPSFYPSHAAVWIADRNGEQEFVDLAAMASAKNPSGLLDLSYAQDVVVDSDGLVWVLAQGLMRNQNSGETSPVSRRMFVIALGNPSYLNSVIQTRPTEQPSTVESSLFCQNLT